MSQEIQTTPSDPVELLTADERKAYKLWKAKGEAPLAPIVQAQLYKLFLNGNTCDDIQRLNPNVPLGMIVRARVDGLWDQRRDRHVATLFEEVRARVQQVQMESVMFTSDLLAAANKQFGDKLKKYIQTGDPRELGDLNINSLKQYRDAVDLLLKLTGQSNKVTVGGEVTQTIEVRGKLSPAEAAVLLKAADQGDK